jgi:TetR/AcrR family tetracycline transcriptional repressor
VALTRDEIVDAALSLLDETGLDGLTLRALAERLGIQAPTLYWHVRNKAHLLDLMAEAIVRADADDADDVPRPGEPWDDWLAGRYRRLRQTLMARRDAALVLAGNRPTPDAAVHVDRTLGALVAAGFTAPEALRAVLALGNFTLGDVIEAQRSSDRGDEDTEVAQARHASVVSGEHPHLAAAGAALGDDEALFEDGLSLMIGGLRSRLEARRHHAAPATNDAVDLAVQDTL